MDPVASYVIRGGSIGLAIAAPVGAIGVLCIRTSLTHGFRAGLAVGMGAATADASYGAVAALGLTAVSNLLLRWQNPVQLLGGLFLCYLGLTTFRTRPQARETQVAPPRLWKTYATTYFLTITNPLTILSFVAVFATLGLGAAPAPRLAVATVAGVFLGSALWWVVLSGAATYVSSYLNDRWMLWINRLSGCVLGGFGLVAVGHSLWAFRYGST
ncbi:MAG TPA: LysE family translocator [Candidatus Limnocylindria bacterium]|jgi:threonine/homoserine/homoserine lactone efflux protein|nr:LysE family translocator [Candidatus Limnocylindria bacterium]